jgi:nitrate/nitrite transport system substrate-binding protein
MAEELGAFSKHGLAPVLQRSTSPIELKDRLLAGELVAAQLPFSQSLALSAAAPPGAAGPTDLVMLAVLSQHGAAVTLARDLCEGVGFLNLDSLRAALARHAAGGTAVFAVPVLGGTTDLLLRYLLGAAGVSADRISFVAAPMERMLADLRAERIVGFAAPDPWPAMAAQQDLGFTFATAQDIWRESPQTALVTTLRTLGARRSELKALLRAIMEAAVWLDVPGNRSRPLLGEVLARQRGLDLDPRPIRARLGSVYDLGCRLGERDFEDYILFFHHAGRVNLPRRADALLFLALLARFGLAPASPRIDVIDRAIRDDLYREVAREMGIPLPDDMKPFVVTLDAVRFDPNTPGQWPTLWNSSG